MDVGYEIPGTGEAQQVEGDGFYSYDGPTMNLVTEPVEVAETTGTAEGYEQRLIGDDLYQYPTSASKPGDNGMAEDYWLLMDAATPVEGASLPFTQQITHLFEIPEAVQLEEVSTEADLTTYSGSAAAITEGGVPGGGGFTVTVDEDSLPQEIVWNVASQGTTMSIAISFEDFGVEEEVQPPPQDAVITIDEYQRFQDKYGATISP